MTQEQEMECLQESLIDEAVRGVKTIQALQTALDCQSLDLDTSGPRRMFRSLVDK